MIFASNSSPQRQQGKNNSSPPRQQGENGGGKPPLRYKGTYRSVFCVNLLPANAIQTTGNIPEATAQRSTHVMIVLLLDWVNNPASCG